VVIDARRDLLATLEVEKPVGLWREEVVAAPVARSRTEAAAALAKDPAAPTVAALARALKGESTFWATRAACAKSLAAIRSPGAKKALLDALKVKHPKARRAVVAALGQFRDDAEVGKALAALLAKGDASYFVEGEAAKSVGKVRAKGAFEALVGVLDRPAFQDAIRCGALEGLAELRDPRGWKIALAATAPGQPPFGRRTAADALARLAEPAEKKTETVERLSELLRDESFRVRLATLHAAPTLGDERLIGPLSTTPFLDGREQRLAREAVRTLRVKSPASELQSLRGDLDKLKGELHALKEELDAKKAK
jgi:aminopeptidase N